MSGLRILMVDDEVDIVESYVEYLRKKVAGSTVLAANSGEEAAKIFAEQPCDVVISDVRMPNGDGYYLVKEVMGGDHPKPIFIFMSGFSDVSMESLKEAGATAILEKPVSLKTLLKTIEDLVAGQKSA